jgi:hypothetical protein
MGLKEDLRTGLFSLQKRGYSIRDELDAHGRAVVVIPFDDAPVRLRNDELVVQVRISSSGRFFTLSSALAMITDPLESEPLEHLLRRQFSADQVGGAGIAIMQVNDVDALTAVQHWPLKSISDAQLSELFEIFMQAFFTLYDEVKNLLENEQPLRMVHS